MKKIFIDRLNLSNLPTPCWLWTGTIEKNGYARFWFEDHNELAHKWYYEFLHGKTVLDLDHLCKVLRCVNPEHLEPVSHRENVLRGSSFMVDNVNKTHCPQGHPYSGDNLLIGSRGSRLCATCAKAHKHAHYLRTKQCQAV